MTADMIVEITNRRARDRQAEADDRRVVYAPVRPRRRRATDTDNATPAELEARPELASVYTSKLTVRNVRFSDLELTLYYRTPAGRAAGREMFAAMGWKEVV